jgi:hypothetical protein
VRAAYEPKGIGFLAVCDEPDLETATRAAQGLDLHLAVAAATSNPILPFGTRSVPDTIYIDAAGKVVAFDRGPRTREQFETRVKALLALK